VSLGSRLLARLARLPTARSRRVGVELDLAVPAWDGVVLLADRYYPIGEEAVPVVLVRTPYGRRSFAIFGRVFAERGYQALIQSVRGTFGSGGRFDAFRDEEADGRATLEWLLRQPWFGGRVGTYGPSYLGFVQWAMAGATPGRPDALAIQVAASNRRSPLYPGESFALDFALTWIHTLAVQERPTWRVVWEGLRRRRTLRPAFLHLPLCEVDRLAVGRRVGFFQDWLEHTSPEDPFWARIDHGRRVGAVDGPVCLVGGFYDYFLPALLEDYRALRAAGRRPQLTLGPWAHADLGPVLTGLGESLAWFDAHLRGDASRLRPSPVRVFMMGSRRFIDLPDWPPPANTVRYHLHPDRALRRDPSVASPPDRYDYDPARPTPSVGGAVIGRHAGPKDNRRLESRADVLTYTSPPLEEDLEVIGEVTAELHVRSSLGYTDFFARLCDVAPGGRSTNLCDGLVRLWPGRLPLDPGGVCRVDVALGATACCFRKGHRLRLQVSSGAHPRFARNLGGGEPLATATTMKVARQEVFHDPEHPSALVLPVYAGRPK
jgi:putative CocE/NonD family hydrolase